MGIRKIRKRAVQPLYFLAVAVLLMLPASAEQTTLDCDKAVANHRAITEFDKQAVREGLQICGTPAMMAREQMQVACTKRKNIGRND